MHRPPPTFTLFPYTTLFRSPGARDQEPAHPDPALGRAHAAAPGWRLEREGCRHPRSEEHTSELQSRQYLVCRLLLEKKNTALYYESGVMLDDAVAFRMRADA